MTPGLRVEVDENQVEIASPIASLRRLAYVQAVNTTGAGVYLSVWAGTGTSRTAASRVAGPWLIPNGQSAPVLIEMGAGACVLAAHTADDGTGAPASAIDVVPMWEA